MMILEKLGLRKAAAHQHKDAKRVEPVKPAVILADRKRMTQRPPSFTEQLPYHAYSATDKLFTFKDGSTLGVLLELAPIPTEAQASDFMMESARAVQEALQALPESDKSPWIVQFYLNDDRDISGLNKYLADYIVSQHAQYPERAKQIINSPFTQAVLGEFEEHLRLVSRDKGLFEDTQVTGQIWRGQQRRVRCCIYKRFPALAEDTDSAREQIESSAVTLMATLTEAGVVVKRCNGRDLYEWLLPFFNRKVPWANSYSGELLEKMPYPGDTAGMGALDGHAGAPIFGWNLAELLNLSAPMSDATNGSFEFDGVPVKALTLQGLRRQPSIGHFSAEQRTGKESFARFDRLPAGSMLAISITISPQHTLERHIEKIRDASRANTATARETHQECEMVLTRMVEGDKLFPMLMTLYVTAPTNEELNTAISQVNAQLTPSGLRFIDSKQDLVSLDGFMRGLPFNFDPAFDNKRLRRSRLTFASQIAALLPVYGRSRGTPHPGIWFWNRGGEPLWVDPLNHKDRKKNAHMLVLGPTGAGKSATLNYISMLTLAVHRPRMVIVDAGQSFALAIEFYRNMGLTCHVVSLSNDTDVSLPPFLYAVKLLQDPDIMDSYYAAEKQASFNASDATVRGAEPPDELVGGPELEVEAKPDENGDDEEEIEKRDLLGEMLIAAIMMITGGESAEIARMTRADRYLVTRAIIKAAVRSKEEGKAHPLTVDVAIELMNMQRESSLSISRQARAEEMGQSMMTFTQGLRGKLFNRPGMDWPDVDVTLVEMGTLTKDGYGDALAVAYTSLLDSVQSRGERFQHENRPLIMLTDEGHLITTNELLGPKIAKATKMWRKLNVWFWLATQNLKDFPDSMSRVLSMCEYWMLLTMDKSEIEEVTRFRSLTNEQRHLMESARKEPPKYTEGVVLSALGQFLFRNVPPALPIALAMTEGHEKAHRRRLMNEHGCTEFEAVKMVAKALVASRG